MDNIEIQGHEDAQTTRVKFLGWRIGFVDILFVEKVQVLCRRHREQLPSQSTLKLRLRDACYLISIFPFIYPMYGVHHAAQIWKQQTYSPINADVILYLNNPIRNSRKNVLVNAKMKGMHERHIV